MKIYKHIQVVLLIAILSLSILSSSCRKANPQNNPPVTNNPLQNVPPVADAGTDLHLALNTTSNTNLDGSGSFDLDNNISGYLWTKISGPSSYSIVNPDKVQAQIKNLTEGIYKFELKITDVAGLVAKDTLLVFATANGSLKIDLKFNMSTVCTINNYLEDDYYWFDDQVYSLFTTTDSSLRGGGSLLSANIIQTRNYHDHSLLTEPSLVISEGSSYDNYIELAFKSNPDFFNLPYNNGPANFSDSVYVISSSGEYTYFKANTTFYCSGVADTTNHLGSISLQGAITFQ